jgi:phosphoribosylglycinamide formyltransferase-1
MSERVPVGVLASGRGSNLQALIDASRDPSYPARLSVVLSNRPNAGALGRARAAGIPAECLLKRDFADREAYDAALVERLQAHAVEWVALAGYMRLVTPSFLAAFPGRVLNIHPSLLPAFPGLHCHEQAIARGVRFSGCTVHFVDSGTDTGPIIDQAVVPVEQGDDAASLAARILVEEHRLYPRCLALAAEGRLRRVGGRVEVKRV